jgi:PAS domain S-box
MNVTKKIKNEILYYNREKSYGPGVVRPEIIESWKRSRDYGLDPKTCRFGAPLDNDAFNNILKEKEYLIRAAEPSIQQLETFLSSDDVIFLTDEQGVILHGNTINVDMLYKLRPGVVTPEKIIGTCAHGLCIIHKKPIQIRGSEHYCEAPGLDEEKQGICSSAPIFNERGELAGTIGIGSPDIKSQNLYTLGLVISTADTIQKQINLEIKNKLFHTTIESVGEAIITIDSQGVITEMNTEANKMFNYSSNLIGMHINDVMGNISLLRSLDMGKYLVDTKLKIASLNKSVYLSLARPIGDDIGNKLGSILTFRNDHLAREDEKSSVPNETKFSFENIVGESPAIVKSVQMAMKFSSNNANILLQGESGTGKEVYAQAIHNNSRPGEPFIAINCAAIPENLIESELFGYESGAFTGAERKGRPGKIELAHGGTLFLDEIGDMPLKLQPVLLRVLEEKKVIRLGGNRNIPVDFRLITATNKDLKELVENLQFREDLYYRIAAFKISIPPLRERGTDILKLAKHFIEVSAKQLNVQVPVLNYATIEQLLNYTWPGNVRQLENAMYYAVNMAEDGTILPHDLPEDITDGAKGKPGEKNDIRFKRSKLSLKESEKKLICEALVQTNKNVGFAADLLGLSKSTLYRKIKEYELLD